MTYKAGRNDRFPKGLSFEGRHIPYSLFLLANLYRCAIIETFFVYKIFTLNL